MSRPAFVGRGLAAAASPEELRDAVLTNRRRAVAKPRRPQPDFLRVACGLACRRWRAVCDDVSLNGFVTRLAAAHCAARDAWAKRLGHGVAMAEIQLVDKGDDTFHAYVNLGRVAG